MPDDRSDRRDEVGPGRREETIAWSDDGPEPGRTSSGPTSMASLAEFERVVAEQGLMFPDEIRTFVADLAPVDAEALAVALVRAGNLSKYQASAILQRKAKVLAIGPYVILDRIGSGGMGIVFKARHRDFVDVLALKLLSPSASKKVDAVQRFRREAQLLARLEHPNLVTSHDIGEYNGVHFLVMDYVDGVDLARIVQASGPLRPARAVDLIVQAARGLGAAHERGIVHRDIKPANLMVDAKGVVRVLDLGLARVSRAGDWMHEDDQSLTQSGIVMGTVDFVSPEQSRDSKRADHRSDIYSLGCTLYFLLTGKPPFARGNTMERLLAHHQEPAPSLRDVRPEIPPDLDAAYQKMMAKDPEHRPQSMAKVIELLEACRASRPDGRMLLVFNDESRARSAEAAPLASRETPSPPTPNPTSPDQDLSGYDLLPPAVSELWSPREAAPKGYKPAVKKVEETPGPNWRAIVMAIAVALLTSAILAAYLGGRPRGQQPPPSPPSVPSEP